MEARIGFYDRARQIFDLTLAQQALEWDQEVMMPAQGADQRAHQLAALATVVHEKLTDPAYGGLIDAFEASRDLDERARADVREARRARERAVRVPGRLVAERTEACARAQAAWLEARPRNDFAAFRPHLERVMDLTRELAEAQGMPSPYDALLDEYEPGMTEARLRPLFDDLRRRLVPLLERIRGASRRPDPAPLARCFPVQDQEVFCRRLVTDMGFDLDAGRFDVSAHPFTTGTHRDVRLTTRYREDWLPCSVFGTIHEGGHGLYEQGLDARFFRDPSGGACSAGLHESQSRLWENLVGRSLPFWSHYYPVLQATFPGVLDEVPLASFHGAVNVVEPSLIRVEADETTYNLHILLRFELESDLIARRITVKDLPELWRIRMEQQLGIAPPDDRSGVMQDIHWAVGLVGYFPTYALGNLYAAQFMERMREELRDLDERLSRGELGVVRTWLRERIHVHGRVWPAQELCERVTGAPLSVEPLMRHLEAKAHTFYGI